MMTRVVLVALAVLLAVAPATAGQNPNAVAFVSFDPSCETGPYVHTTPFTAAGIYDSYVCVDGFGSSGGIRTLAFSMTTSGLSPMLPDYTVFDATAQGTGGPDASFWLIGAQVCVYPNACGIVTVVKQQFFVMSPGTISLGGSPVDGKMVVDCNFDADQFCVMSNGGIGAEPPAGDEDCDTPVELQSWGSIKALYR
jgi:hypothetical protein